MTIRELAPMLFVALFLVVGAAIVGEIVLVVSARLARARGLESPGDDGRRQRARRVLRIVAPACLLGAGAILAWLSTSPASAPASAGGASDGAAAAREAVGPDDASLAIHRSGVGAATVGMTLDELRAALDPAVVVGEPSDRFMVDAIAVPVVAGADTLYRLVFPAGAEVDGGTPLELVATTHSRARTPEGVGPGTTLGAAAERYGAPTLSYSVHDESREYARFPDQPSDRVLFRVAPPPGLSSLAGSYTTDAEYNETTAFDPEARIVMVLVRLRAAATSGAAPPP